MEHSRIDIGCGLDDNCVHEISANSLRPQFTIPRRRMTGNAPTRPIAAADMRVIARRNFSPWHGRWGRSLSGETTTQALVLPRFHLDRHRHGIRNDVIDR